MNLFKRLFESKESKAKRLAEMAEAQRQALEAQRLALEDKRRRLVADAKTAIRDQDWEKRKAAAKTLGELGGVIEVNTFEFGNVIWELPIFW